MSTSPTFESQSNLGPFTSTSQSTFGPFTSTFPSPFELKSKSRSGKFKPNPCFLSFLFFVFFSPELLLSECDFSPDPPNPNEKPPFPFGFLMSTSPWPLTLESQSNLGPFTSISQSTFGPLTSTSPM